MKKCVIIVILLSLFCGGCAKMYEKVKVERTERPTVGVVDPKWDSVRLTR